MSNSTKIYPIKTLTALSSGTLTIDTGDFIYPIAPNDTHSYYRLEGSVTLSGDLVISSIGTLHNNLRVRIINDASITLASTHKVKILGKTVPDEVVAGKYIVEAIYSTTASAWSVVIMPDISITSLINADRIETDAVTTAKLLNANVTLAKIQNVAANSVLVRDANSSGVLSEKAVTTTQILIGDGTGFTAAALSGDVTMTNAGVVTLASNSVVTADITDANVTTAKILDANITAGKLATDSVTLPKLASTGSLGSLYAAVGTDAATTEKTLWSVTVGAAQLGATGESIEVVAFGSTAANGNNKTIKLTIDGINVVTSGTLTSNNKIWCLRGLITRTGSNTSWMSGSITVDGVVTDIQTAASGTMTTAWTSAVALAITGQNGTAAANDIVLNHANAKYIA